MKKILYDPIVHFVVIGVFLFVLFSNFGNDTETKKEDIVVDTSRIERIQAAWEKQWRRKPTGPELDRLIDNYIQEEVLFREAQALGLDKDDTIIRRRLSQKMKFLIKDITSSQPPDEIALADYYNKNKESFGIPARLTFSHIYFNPDKRGSSAVADASEALDALGKKDTDAGLTGDPFMLHTEYADVSEPEVSKLFGRTFSERLFELRPGMWQGPVRSGYGVHLVRIREYIPAKIPDFSEVKDRVTTEYMNDFRIKANKKAIDELKSRYRIIVKKESSGQDTPVTSSSVNSSGSDS